MDIRITKAKVKNHWHYSRWKYLLLVVVSIMGVDMLFASTRYVPPANKKIDMYLCNGYADAAAVEETLLPAFLEAAPDQEALSVLNIDLLDGDAYTSMQFNTYIGAQEGDVLLLPKSVVETMVDEEGADYTFVCLDAYLESGELDAHGVDLSAGMMRGVDGSMGVYAIPADTLYGLTQFSCDPAQSMLCLTSFTQNPENGVKIINLLFELYQTEKPDWYGAAQEETSTQSGTQLFH